MLRQDTHGKPVTVVTGWAGAWWLFCSGWRRTADPSTTDNSDRNWGVEKESRVWDDKLGERGRWEKVCKMEET